MDLKLKRLLEQAQFTKYKGRGYDAAEVDDFLDRATAMAAKVEVQLTEALGRSGSTPASDEPVAPAGPSPEEIETEIERRVQAKVAELPPPPAAAPAEPVDDSAALRAAEDAAEEARRTLVLAQRTADAAVREAREEADQLLNQAREQASSGTAEAETTAQRLRSDAEAHAQKLRSDAENDARRDRDEARDRLAAEIRDLEQAREAIRSDVHALEHHVELQRSKVGSAIGELQRVFDDPDGIHLTPAPAADSSVPEVMGDAASAQQAVDHETGDESGDESSDHEPEARSSATDESTVPAADTPPEGGSPSFASPPPAPRRDTTEQAPADPVAIADVDHQVPGGDAPTSTPDSSGPPTSQVDAIDLDLPAVDAGSSPSDPSSTDDAFLAELRKAMADDEPLGPRDTEASEPAELFGDDRPRRFGRRR